LDKVRRNLLARGYKTVRGIGKSFSIIDVNGDRKIDKLEFYQGLQDLGANITKQEG
jgi:Ca2+-binding EF-hand superfamily protein